MMLIFTSWLRWQQAGFSYVKSLFLNLKKKKQKQKTTKRKTSEHSSQQWQQQCYRHREKTGAFQREMGAKEK